MGVSICRAERSRRYAHRQERDAAMHAAATWEYDLGQCGRLVTRIVTSPSAGNWTEAGPPAILPSPGCGERPGTAPAWPPGGTPPEVDIGVEADGQGERHDDAETYEEEGRAGLHPDRAHDRGGHHRHPGRDRDSQLPPLPAPRAALRGLGERRRHPHGAA